MEWSTLSSAKPRDGDLCWITNGDHVRLAYHRRDAANGWQDDASWEDWDSEYNMWVLIPKPTPPSRISGGV